MFPVNQLFINLGIPSHHASFLHKQCNKFVVSDITMPLLKKKRKKKVTIPMRGNFRVLCPCVGRKFDWDVAVGVARAKIVSINRILKNNYHGMGKDTVCAV